MTYQQAVEKINSLLVFGSRPGLERIREFVDRLGSPDKKLRFVHAAGTNGKGSTCALISAALTKAGYKTGLFISPYVLEFRERFQIDGEMIPPQTLADIVERISPVAEEMKNEGKVITEFEFVLAAALVWYAEEKCDIVVLETGLGGRFDATNIIDCPEASVITSISLDHTAILGDTYEKIAFEKCGIIKQGGITVAYGKQMPQAMEVIRNTADERNNRFIVADASEAEIITADITGTVFSISINGQSYTLRLRLIGDHQIGNATAALHTLIALRERGFNIPDGAIREGFASVSFPARLELLHNDPIILLDGAHNPDGAASLTCAVKRYLSDRKKIGIVGMLADKDVDGALSGLLPLFDVIITTEPENPRKMSATELAAIASRYCPEVFSAASHKEAYDMAVSRAKADDAVVVFGSLYLASDMRRIILSE